MFPSPLIFGHQVDWFQDLQYVGIVISILVFIFRRSYLKIDKPLYLLSLILLIIFLGYVGARFIEVIEAILTNNLAAQKFSFFELLTKKGGTRIYGAFLFNFIFFAILIRFFKRNELLGFLDEIVIAGSAGIIFGKLGCQFSGHGCYGVPTNLPWGMRYPYGSMPSYLPVHPTPFYDAIVYALLFAALIYASKNKKFDGQMVVYFLLIVCVASILIEIVRNNEAVFLSMSLAQIVYIFLLFGTLIFYKKATLKQPN